MYMQNQPPPMNSATSTVVQPQSGAAFITNPGQHDVILGRGGRTNNHCGNVAFRNLICHYKLRYIASSKTEKPNVARAVVELWSKLDPPGRFLAKATSDKDDPRWVVVADQKAREKASQCLRERTADVLPYVKQLREEQTAAVRNTTGAAVLLLQQQQQQQRKQQEGTSGIETVPQRQYQGLSTTRQASLPISDGSIERTDWQARMAYQTSTPEQLLESNLKQQNLMLMQQINQELRNIRLLSPTPGLLQNCDANGQSAQTRAQVNYDTYNINRSPAPNISESQFDQQQQNRQGGLHQPILYQPLSPFHMQKDHEINKASVHFDLQKINQDTIVEMRQRQMESQLPDSQRGHFQSAELSTDQDGIQSERESEGLPKHQNQVSLLSPPMPHNHQLEPQLQHVHYDPSCSQQVSMVHRPARATEYSLEPMDPAPRVARRRKPRSEDKRRMRPPPANQDPHVGVERSSSNISMDMEQLTAPPRRQTRTTTNGGGIWKHTEQVLHGTTLEDVQKQVGLYDALHPGSNHDSAVSDLSWEKAATGLLSSGFDRGVDRAASGCSFRSSASMSLGNISSFGMDFHNSNSMSRRGEASNMSLMNASIEDLSLIG
jgi:hypothetical protein